MSTRENPEAQQVWQKFAEEAAKQTNSEKFIEMVEHLCGALNKRNRKKGPS